MRRPPLTDLAIKALAPPTKGSKILWDSLPGFGCRISQAGTRAFVVLIGGGRTQTIGRYPSTSLSDARREAKRLLAEKTLGRVKPTHTAFEDALGDYLAACGQKNRPSTLQSYRRHLAAHYRFGRKSVADITPREITRTLNAITGQSERFHATVVGKLFFKWCVSQHIIDRSPMETISAPVGKARERVLNDDELKAIYRTALKGQTPFHKIVCLLILTGQRRGEIAQLQWDWIKDDGTIELPASVTKNKRTHTFPYGPQTQNIIAGIARCDDQTYLFPAARDRSRDRPATVFNGWSKPKAQFDRACNITDWTLHDIRRTVATNLQRLGVRLEVTEALLNHISGSRAGIVGIYQRHRYLDEMREAVTLWENHLEALCAKP